MTTARVAFTGASHWHFPLYAEPAMVSEGIRVVGVADPDEAAARRAAARVSCEAWTDWREMCERARPDFVFVLGRHCDMPEVVRGMIARRIPFAVEKPAGMDAATVAALAREAGEAGVFASVPFVLRRSTMLRTIAEVAAGETVESLSWKFVGGSNDRYRDAGCLWMLSRATSGGGCMLNLGIHFIDLSRLLLGGELRVAGAMMSNLRDGLDVEDHGVLLLRGARGTAVIETGYLYPAPHMAFDLHFSVRTSRHYFAAKDDRALEIRDERQAARVVEMPITNVPFYPGYVRDVIARAARGAAPEAGLSDLAAAMALLEEGYAMSPLAIG